MALISQNKNYQATQLKNIMRNLIFSEILYITLQLYHELSQQDCYTPSTQLNIYDDYIEIQFKRIQNIYCDFPLGVMIVLKFEDIILNIAQIYNDFSYNETDHVILNFINCQKYTGISAVTIIIDSPQLTTILNAGSIQIIRKGFSKTNQKIQLTFDGMNTCFSINQANIGQSYSQKQITIIFQYINKTIYELINPTPIYEAQQTKFCTKEDIKIVQLQLVKITISGQQTGITVSEIYRTFDFIISNQPNIISGLELAVFKKYIHLEIGRFQLEFDKFTKIIDYTDAMYIFQIAIDNHAASFSGPLIKDLFEKNGNIPCFNSYNITLCENILDSLQTQDMSKAKGKVFFIFGAIIIGQQITKYISNCFENVNIQIYRNKLEVTYNFANQQTNICQLTDQKVYSFYLGFFSNSDKFQQGFYGLQTIGQIDVEWDNISRSIFIQYDSRHQQQIKILLKHQFIEIMIYSQNREYINEARVLQVNFNLYTNYMLCVSCIVASQIILSICLYFVQNYMKKSKCKIIKIQSNAEELQ
ncbi:hypothetical protein SS50377_27458 [Spironucleus salmonicida]|uniref:Transmembrane protein n=1 Tax=Spironucleus salmonicida TaxID=348837 RepID=V6LFI1_9EUKA|nr:hypothetical protein SS50377_27458 [Spironucleus salmonicida]|eukprot:EST43252.1 Hypothetical protein SS50377_16917 [Spironucleus salmonicida]